MSWNLWALPGTLAMLVAWAAAIVIHRVAPGRALNRRLALVMVLEGLFMTGLGVIFLVNSAAVAYAFGILQTAALFWLPFVYLGFLGVSLETPLVRPFRSRRVFWLLVAAGGLGAAAIVAVPDRFVSQPYPPGWAPWNFRLQGWGGRVTQLNSLSNLFGLVAALSALLTTQRGTAARERAKWFAIAFGVRDLYGATGLLYPTLRPVPFWGDFIYNPGNGLAVLTYIVLLAYGVLRTQLFDIDLKIKLALRGSTVGAVLAGAFLVFSEMIESVVPVQSRVAGVISALAIVALLRPVQRLAERFTDRLMSGVTATPDYLDARRIEVYRAALEGALEDGVVTEREAAILTRLREQLELTDEDIRAAKDGLALDLSAG